MKTIILFLLCGQLYAWGPIGHYIIGDIASKHLKTDVKKKVDSLLKGETVARIGVWADFIKSNSSLRYLNQWHYINVPQGKRYLDLTPSTKGDLFSGIIHCVNILKSKKSKRSKKELALKMIIHLIADLHQPFHNGYGKDRGGNTIKVSWFGEKTNLHMVWDEHMIELQKLSYSEYSMFLNRLSNKDVSLIEQGSLYSWHLESRALLEGLYTRQEGRHWEYNYTYRHLATVEQRLTYAGIRLASILNKVFSKKTDSKLTEKLINIVPKLKFL